MNPARRGLLGLALAAPLAAARAAPAGQSPRGLAGITGKLFPGKVMSMPGQPGEAICLGLGDGCEPIPSMAVQRAPTFVHTLSGGMPDAPGPWGWDTLENVR